MRNTGTLRRWLGLAVRNRLAGTAASWAMICLLAVVGCAADPARVQAADGSDSDNAPPAVPREFRGVWVATVANIDWPSKPGLTSEQQREELDAIIELAQQMKLNAIVFQVRTTGDALYASEIEPWSAYLTGEQGKDPGWDPLAYAIEKAHARGIELHAWINPLRVGHPSYTGTRDDQHISVRRPDMVRAYGPLLWLDPGHPDTLQYTMDVVRDIVSRYDVDGLHIDDYFYPYPRREDGKALPFPDAETFAAYQADGGRLELADWRRQNVDRMVEAMYRTIKRTRAEVKFGVSPFGIWQPGNPPHIKGMNQYEAIYADAKKWLERGWLDYFTPQLYWSIAKPDQGFISLLEWWSEHNPRDRHLWPGLYTSRTEDGTSAAFDANEVPYQVQWTRILLPEDRPGHIHFSAKALLQNRAGLRDRLSKDVYNAEALPPATPWLTRQRLRRPQVTATVTEAGTVRLEVEQSSLRNARWWTVQTLRGERWDYRVLPAGTTQVTLPAGPSDALPEKILVTAYDRNANAGPSAEVSVPRLARP